MKKETYMLIALIPVLIGFGCDSKQSIIQSREDVTVMTDTIENLPFPAKGKMLDPDSLAEPKTVPILHAPKTVPARNNVFIADPPFPMPLSDVPEIITPGENGIPLPDTIIMLQELTTVRHPRPVVAGPLTMKPEAIADIQILSISHGLKNPFVPSILEDRRGNLWIKNGEYLSRYDGQHFIHYSAKDGIGSGNLFTSSMMEDRRGNLWLGGNGLSRYDGNKCTSYSIGEGQDNFTIISMLEDQEGKLWFGTYYGVFCYNPSANSSLDQFAKFTPREGLIDRTVYSMLQDQKGKLWFGTTLGLSRFDGRHFTNFPIEGEDNQVKTMIEDGEGILWLGTNDGLIRFNPLGNAGRGSFSNINIEVGRVNALTEDDKGNIWIAGYREGLFCLLRNENGIGNNYVRYTQNEGLNGSYFHAMIKDSHGNIWIGGQNGGLSRINNKNPILYYNQAIGLKANLVDCIIEDSHGFLWFGLTNKAGALKYDAADGGTFTNYGTAEGLIDESVTSLMEDSQGNIWMGSWGSISGNGVSRLNRSKRQFQSDPSYTGKDSFTFFNTESGLLHRNVISMIQDSRGNLWFGNRGGVTYYEQDYFSGGSGRFFHYTLDGGTRLSVHSLLEDRNGDIWIGIYERGVYKLDLNLTEKKMKARRTEADKKLDWIEGKTFTHFTTKDGLSDNQIGDIIEDSHGMLWFASMNGLSRYDPTEQRFYTYGSEDGVLSDHLLAMAEDRQKRLWILSQSGMNVVVSGQKNEADPSARVDYQFFTFSAPDGFGTIDSGFKNIFITQQNQLWWATGNGVASLDLNNFELPQDAPKINLNSIEIEQTYLDFSGSQDNEYRKSVPLMEQLTGTFDSVAAFNNYPLNLTLPYDINHVTFQFTAIDWTSPHQLQYSYLMEGMDKTWSELSTETKADYRNLAPGDYTFKVKAIGIAKKWSEEFEYSFVIRPPWWQTWWAYTVYGLLFVTGVFVTDRFQRKRLIEKERQKSRDKELEQAKEIEKAYYELEVSHSNLKSTQSQLIQSEKMASLGELTAGIAHEIQNPLNFVNNFSEVNRELIEELKEAVASNDQVEIQEILKDLAENEDKVKHHGQRAEGIVKGMLQHSRTSQGEKELTDINALADEYLRLAYHGLRAKDKSFNADFKTDLDPALPKVNVIPQDIGRVLLNLINNAFYAVDKKATRHSERSEESKDYKPEVIVTTKSNEKSIEISIRDNGLGIPEEIKDKIFQPFFTTKPTGSGTGLGLSLSYDIVKAHGGTLSVKSIEHHGTEFTILL